jgi:pyruvate-formate lyase-activating enzyme
MLPNFKIKPKEKYTHTEELKNFGCTVPFKHIEIHSSGAVSLCCHTWLPAWAGNLLEDSIDDVIDNGIRKEIQNLMKKGDFRCCNDHCPQLNSFMSGEKDYWDLKPLNQLEDTLERRAMSIGFSYDLSCNLQCPSCRDKLILWRPDDENDVDGQRIKKIHEKVKVLVDRMLEEHPIVNLDITGSGDAFASPLYWEYLVELASKPVHKNLRLHIKTNGVMMTEENWLQIKPLWKHITFIEVSVDAATEDVYKIVRKNGNFKRLKKNLEVLDNMVFSECFHQHFNWQTNFIVQRDNFRDLKEFVDWQLTLKSKPKIWTNLLAQWWHISDERFKGMAVWQEGHIGRDDLIEILKDPVFKNPQLKLGNMTSLVP